MEQTIHFKLNRRPVSVTTDEERPLLWILRTNLGLTGTKFGCGHNQCGVCTVIVNNDGSKGVHNPAYARALLENALAHAQAQGGGLVMR